MSETIETPIETEVTVPNVMTFTQALKDAGFTAVDEILEITTGLFISNFYDVVQQNFANDEDLKESLQRMDNAHAKVMESLGEVRTPAEAFLTLLVAQREILDAVTSQQPAEPDEVTE